MTDELVFSSTGITFTPLRYREIREYDPRKGEHCWIIVVTFAFNPDSKDAQICDNETMYGYPQAGCYYCEEPYSEELKHRRCPGEGE